MIDPLVEMIRVRVAERRKAGLYPEGLEEELDAHFKRIVAHRHDPDLADLRSSLEVLAVRASSAGPRFPSPPPCRGGTTSTGSSARSSPPNPRGPRAGPGVRRRGPGDVRQGDRSPGRALQPRARRSGRAARRHLGTPGGVERGPVDSAAAVADLRRRVERLEAAEEARQFDPPFTSSEFESAFRGSADDLKDRYQDAGRGVRRASTGARHRVWPGRVPRAAPRQRRRRRRRRDRPNAGGGGTGRRARDRHRRRRRVLGVARPTTRSAVWS